MAPGGVPGAERGPEKTLAYFDAVGARSDHSGQNGGGWRGTYDMMPGSFTFPRDAIGIRASSFPGTCILGSPFVIVGCCRFGRRRKPLELRPMMALSDSLTIYFLSMTCPMSCELMPTVVTCPLPC